MGFTLYPYERSVSPHHKREYLMKYTKYEVWFSNCNYDPKCVKVSALNQNDALILAQAKRIKDGLDYTLFKIEEQS